MPRKLSYLATILCTAVLFTSNLLLAGMVSPGQLATKSSNNVDLQVYANDDYYHLNTTKKYSEIDVNNLLVRARFNFSQMYLSPDSCTRQAQMAEFFYEEINAKKRITIPTGATCRVASIDLHKELNEKEGIKNQRDLQALKLENQINHLSRLDGIMTLLRTAHTYKAHPEAPTELLELIIADPEAGLSFIAFVERFAQDILGMDLNDVFKRDSKLGRFFQVISRGLWAKVFSKKSPTKNFIIQYLFDIKETIEARSNELIAIVESEGTKEAIDSILLETIHKHSALLVSDLTEYYQNRKAPSELEFVLDLQSFAESSLEPTTFLKLIKNLKQENSSQAESTIRVLNVRDMKTGDYPAFAKALPSTPHVDSFLKKIWEKEEGAFPTLPESILEVFALASDSKKMEVFPFLLRSELFEKAIQSVFSDNSIAQDQWIVEQFYLLLFDAISSNFNEASKYISVLKKIPTSNLSSLWFDSLLKEFLYQESSNLNIAIALELTKTAKNLKGFTEVLNPIWEQTENLLPEHHILLSLVAAVDPTSSEKSLASLRTLAPFLHITNRSTLKHLLDDIQIPHSLDAASWLQSMEKIAFIQQDLLDTALSPEMWLRAISKQGGNISTLLLELAPLLHASDLPDPIKLRIEGIPRNPVKQQVSGASARYGAPEAVYLDTIKAWGPDIIKGELLRNVSRFEWDKIEWYLEALSKDNATFLLNDYETRYWNELYASKPFFKESSQLLKAIKNPNSNYVSNYHDDPNAISASFRELATSQLPSDIKLKLAKISIARRDPVYAKHFLMLFNSLSPAGKSELSLFLNSTLLRHDFKLRDNDLNNNNLKSLFYSMVEHALYKNDLGLFKIIINTPVLQSAGKIIKNNNTLPEADYMSIFYTYYTVLKKAAFWKLLEGETGALVKDMLCLQIESLSSVSMLTGSSTSDNPPKIDLSVLRDILDFCQNRPIEGLIKILTNSMSLNEKDSHELLTDLFSMNSPDNPELLIELLKQQTKHLARSEGDFFNMKPYFEMLPGEGVLDETLFKWTFSKRAEGYTIEELEKLMALGKYTTQGFDGTIDSILAKSSIDALKTLTRDYPMFSRLSLVKEKSYPFQVRLRKHLNL